MEQLKIIPRFNDTDALGHINNASIVSWFEEARRSLFKVFIPDLDPKKWNLIIARVEVDYLAQGQFNEEVLLNTWIEKVGNSSIVVVQEAIQLGTPIARGKAIMVHFDYELQKSAPIPEEIKSKLLTQFSPED